MRTGRGRTTIALLVLIGLITLALPAYAGPERGRPVYYLALGDSLSKGVQPVGGVNVATDDGYANQLFAALQGSNPRLELHQLGCEVTETTKTMLRGGGTCSYDHRSQLGDAIVFLRKHRGSVALVTIDVGANDIEPCAKGLDIDDECVQEAFIQVAANLPPILAALRLAAGPHVPIVGMNYYNPFLAAWLAGLQGIPEGFALAQESAEKLAAFNGLLGSIYRFFRMPVADVAAAFRSDDFTTLVSFPVFGEVPHRWSYLITLRNASDRVIQLERVERAVAGDYADFVGGAPTSQPFRRKLEARSELRVPMSDNWGWMPRANTTFGGAATLRPMMAFRYFKGTDDRGTPVEIQVRVRLDPTVGRLARPATMPTSLPAPKTLGSERDLVSLAGVWRGSYRLDGWLLDVPIELTILADGNCEVAENEPVTNRFRRAVRVKDGGLEYSGDRERGTLTLHEAEGRRMLTGRVNQIDGPPYALYLEAQSAATAAPGPAPRSTPAASPATGARADGDST